MTKDEIIKLAREAGIDGISLSFGYETTLTRERWEIECQSQVEIERDRILALASEACRSFGKSGAVLMAAIRAKVGA